MPSNIRKLAEKRKQLGKKATVVKTKKGLVNSKNMKRTVDRFSARKKYLVESHDKLIRDPRSKEHYTKITATEVATRLALKDLLKPFRTKLKPQQQRLIEKLILQRSQTIPGTNISLREPREILFMRLINELGEKKTEKTLERLSLRARALQKMAHKSQKGNERMSDVFINIGPKVGMMLTEFELIKMNKKDFVNRVNEFIGQRVGDVQILQESPVKNKKFFLKELQAQMKDAIMARIKFQMNNNLPL